jgi:hypothetical protein
LAKTPVPMMLMLLLVVVGFAIAHVLLAEVLNRRRLLMLVLSVAAGLFASSSSCRGRPTFRSWLGSCYSDPPRRLEAIAVAPLLACPLRRLHNDAVGMVGGYMYGRKALEE